MSGSHRYLVFGLCMALPIVWSTGAVAYQRYNEGCQICHGHFTDELSPQGNVFLSDNKHEMHRNSSEMNADCDLCHRGGDNKNPYLGSSSGIKNGPTGLGCCGCHGREEDAGAFNGINLDVSPGRGAGLRQHHTNAGWNLCRDCHWDADPANYTPVDENVVPPYYGLAAYSFADSPLNPTAQFQINENWTVGDFVGLDNDGDQVYDSADTGTVTVSPVAVHGGPYWGIVGNPLVFDGSLTVDPDGTIASYDWTFGDSGTATGANPTHTYTTAGLYTVTLTVTDNDGATDMATTTAEIVVASTAPPVNQFVGMLDQSATAMTEADCRSCHVAPPPPERHHGLIGEAILPGSVIPYDDVDGTNGPDPFFGCFNCHEPDFSLGGDCIWCHTSDAHHSSPDATGGVCTSCHGDVVDDTNDGHYIPSYTPSSLTPRRSNGAGLPQNSVGTFVGGCDYCHDNGASGNLTIDKNRDLHHTGVYAGNCQWCHDTASGPSGDDTGGQIRVCENCHGPDSLHNIQADSTNANNLGSLVVGGEDLGYGHVGRDAGPGDSDCWGCHGFAMPLEVVASAAGARGTGALVPTVYGCEPSIMTAGTSNTVLVLGSAFTNTTVDTQYTSSVLLTAADGTTTTLAPKDFGEGGMRVTIPSDTPAGNYRLRAVKTDKSGESVASNPVGFSVLPRVHVTEAVSPETTTTITGGGFGVYAAGSVTSVIGERRIGYRFMTQEATIISWSDTTIVASFDARPDFVTVHSIFGSATSVVIKKSNRDKD